MKDEDLLDTVVRLYRDQMTPESSQKLSQGILWQLRNELEKSKKFGNVGKSIDCYCFAGTPIARVLFLPRKGEFVTAFMKQGELFLPKARLCDGFYNTRRHSLAF